ncbi:hypothetical protein BDZ97DRAFT_1918744 [Flammula alnicola]|nr:hypothetical protein BDZ97DRAFT_1918744 [Flammula alnicola]
MVLIRSPASPLTLPQELVDLIINEVVAQTADNPSLRDNTLRAVSCISKTFYFRARVELFSNIYFPRYQNNDHESTQRRAARLIAILEKDASSVHGIHSISLVRDVPSHLSPSTPSLSRLLVRSKGAINHFARRTGLQRDYMVKLLHLILRSPSLENFSLEVYSHGGPWYRNRNPWTSFNNHETSILKGIRSNPSLKSLKYVDIDGLPKAFILGDFVSSTLQELVLIRTTIALRKVREVEEYDIASRTAGRIETLTLCHVWYAGLFTTLRTYLPQLPFGSRSLSPSIYFSNLKTLTVTVATSRYDMEELWIFMLGVSRSLETLELRDHEAYVSGNSPLSFSLICVPFPRLTRSSERTFIELFSLGQLTSLKTLKLCASVSTSISKTWGSKFRTMNKLLASAKSPVGIECISIEIYVAIEPNLCTALILQDLGWSWVDEGLVNPQLMSLGSVLLHIKKYYYDPNFDDGMRYRLGGDQFDPLILLPRAPARPSIEFKCSVESIYSSRPLGSRLDI